MRMYEAQYHRAVSVMGAGVATYWLLKFQHHDFLHS